MTQAPAQAQVQVQAQAPTPGPTGASPTAVDVLVVGGGLGGLTAALVLARMRASVLVVDAGQPRNAAAAAAHGFPGRDGVDPVALLADARADLDRYRVPVEAGRVLSLSGSLADGFTARVGDMAAGSGSRGVRARRVVLATGLRDRLPDVPGVAQRWGREVAHCPFCHGWELRDRPTAILSAHPMAAHSALLVARLAARVTVFTMGPAPFDDAAAARLARAGVEVRTEPVARLCLDSGDGTDGEEGAEAKVSGVELAGGEVVRARAVYVSPASEPADGLLRELGAATVPTPFGDFVGTDPFGATSVPGVWAVGNVADPSAQLVVAAAQGYRAAGAVVQSLVAEDVG